MTGSYESFARVYDELMDNVPYDEWTAFLVDLLHQNGIKEGLICELGCGTGNVTERLANAGYDMIGIDNSYDMLAIAREKQYDADEVMQSILYLQQDMREFELYGTVAAIVSICDSINYIVDPNDLVTVFGLVNNYLDPQGLFLFDFNTQYKYEQVIGNRTIAENREDCSFIWENTYDPQTQLNEYDLTVFVKEMWDDEAEETPDFENEDRYEDACEDMDEEEVTFRRFREMHYQRGYTLEEIQVLLTKGGLSFVEAIDMDTKKQPAHTSERILVVAKEQGK